LYDTDGKNCRWDRDSKQRFIFRPVFLQCENLYLAAGRDAFNNPFYIRSTVSLRLCPTKYVYIKSTTVYVPLSELGLSQQLPTPLSPASVPLPQNRDGGVGWHTRLRARGWGSSNSDDLRKSLALCLLCAVSNLFSRVQSRKFLSRIIKKFWIISHR
jgi:hypothetical protein